MVAPEVSARLQAHPQQTMEISLAFIGSAFLAGLLTFLAPCTLPLVPAYLGFISGVDVSEETDDLSSQKHRKIIANAAMFVIGFSTIFILFGMLAGLAGQALAQWRIWLTRISGVFIILFGIVMIFDVSLDIFASKNLRLPDWAKNNNPFSSLLLGGAFAFGWTPCVGPILGSILALASQQATVLSGGFLLAVFSLGLALPFLGLSVFYARFSSWIKHSKFWLQTISRIGGVFLVLLGILLLTNNFSLLIQYGYDWFEFLNYESLEQYL
jgi:cytochrome c-type biogenesis protein